MSSRLSRHPSKQLVTRLQKIRRTQNELKTGVQRTSGSSGQLNYTSQAPGTWDFSETVGTTSDTSTHTVTFAITFTGDGSQQYPNQECFANIYVGSVASANQLTPLNPNVSGIILVANPLHLQNPAESYVQSNPANYGSATTWSWSVVLSSSTAGVPFTYWLKAASIGTSRGSLSVSRVIA